MVPSALRHAPPGRGASLVPSAAAFVLFLVVYAGALALTAVPLAPAAPLFVVAFSCPGHLLLHLFRGACAEDGGDAGACEHWPSPELSPATSGPFRAAQAILPCVISLMACGMGVSVAGWLRQSRGVGPLRTHTLHSILVASLLLISLLLLPLLSTLYEAARTAAPEWEDLRGALLEPASAGAYDDCPATIGAGVGGGGVAAALALVLVGLAVAVVLPRWKPWGEGEYDALSMLAEEVEVELQGLDLSGAIGIMDDGDDDGDSVESLRKREGFASNLIERVRGAPPDAGWDEKDAGEGAEEWKGAEEAGGEEVEVPLPCFDPGPSGVAGRERPLGTTHR